MLVLLAVLSMIAKDAAVEFNTIAQVRGRAKLSAVLSPITTLTGFAVTGIALVPVSNHGVTQQTVAIVGAILITDMFDGYIFTWLGRRIGTQK